MEVETVAVVLMLHDSLKRAVSNSELRCFFLRGEGNEQRRTDRRVLFSPDLLKQLKHARQHRVLRTLYVPVGAARTVFSFCCENTSPAKTPASWPSPNTGLQFTESCVKTR